MKRPVAANLRTVAQHAGVSATTVSRVLNNNPIPSEATRRRVLAAVEKLNYKPDHLLSQAMRRQRSNNRSQPQRTQCVGLLTSNRVYDALQHQSPYYNAVIAGVHDVLNEANYHLMFSISQVERVTDIPPVVAQGRVDGLLVQCLMEQPLRRLLVKQLPVVFVDRLYRDVDADCVQADQCGAMQQQLEYLWGLGHRRIAYFEQSIVTPYQAARLEGYAKFFQQRPRPDIDPKLYQAHHIDPASHEQVLRDYARLLYHARPRPTAVVGTNGYVMFIMRELQELGLRVPDDISVIGINDQTSGELTNPPLTSYEIPMHEMGRVGAQLLLERLNRPETPMKRVELQGRPIIRASCRALTESN